MFRPPYVLRGRHDGTRGGVEQYRQDDGDTDDLHGTVDKHGTGAWLL